MKRIVGLLLVIATLMIGIGSNIGPFVDGPSLVIVILFTIAALLLGDAQIGVMFRGPQVHADAEILLHQIQHESRGIAVLEEKPICPRLKQG